MIRIEIPNMTVRQHAMLTALWNMNSTEEVEEWIASQPNARMRKEAELMRELMLLAFIDQEHRVDVAKKQLDKIFR